MPCTSIAPYEGKKGGACCVNIMSSYCFQTHTAAHSKRWSIHKQMKTGLTTTTLTDCVRASLVSREYFSFSFLWYLHRVASFLVDYSASRDKKVFWNFFGRSKKSIFLEKKNSKNLAKVGRINSKVFRKNAKKLTRKVRKSHLILDKVN